MKKDFYTVADIARALNVCQATVYKWMQKGKISIELRQLGLTKIKVISQEELDRLRKERE